MPRLPVKRRFQRINAQQRQDHAEKIAAEFNRKFPVGSQVWYFLTLPFGPVKETTVRHPAFVADSGNAVAYLAGISGYVSVFHVWPVDESRRQDMKFAAG